MVKPRVSIDLTDKQLALLARVIEEPTLLGIIRQGQKDMVPLMRKYRQDKKRGPNPNCSGGATCPCICHDTGGADYGEHGPNGGRCNGSIKKESIVEER